MTTRRTALKSLAGVFMAAGSTSPGTRPPAASAQPANPAPGAFRKAVLISMLPKERSYAERFAIAGAAGFEAVEMQTIERPDEATEIAEAASTLLVPAVVDPATSYRDAWSRSQRVIRERLLPVATQLKVTIAVEEVWNKFLLSPIEFARYVDEFDSPFVRAYFDVGNVVFYGYPQDWIRTLGARIARVHLKDFQLDRPNGRFAWKNLGEGDVDWTAVSAALAEVGYRGYVTTEVSGGDAAYLRDLAGRIDRPLRSPMAARGGNLGVT